MTRHHCPVRIIATKRARHVDRQTPGLFWPKASGLNFQSILWFDPRREHSFVPTAGSHAVARRACQGWPRLSRPPEGLGLDWPEHGGILVRIETAGARQIVGTSKPVVLRQIHAAGDIDERFSVRAGASERKQRGGLC